MISLTKSLPPLDKPNAELIKIHCLFDCYQDDDNVLFWTQDETKAVISMTDGNMIIYNHDADLEELREFVSALSPACVFSDIDTLNGLGLFPGETNLIFCRTADIQGSTPSDELSSKQLYELLDVEGLSLPEYDYFAVDYCRRLNMGGAQYFGLEGKCAAISFNSGDYAIMNGIASHAPGAGKTALTAILQKNFGRTFLICCRESVRGFYEKSGFTVIYKAAYWVKKLEE